MTFRPWERYTCTPAAAMVTALPLIALGGLVAYGTAKAFRFSSNSIRNILEDLEERAEQAKAERARINSIHPVRRRAQAQADAIRAAHPEMAELAAAGQAMGLLKNW